MVFFAQLGQCELAWQRPRRPPVINSNMLCQKVIIPLFIHWKQIAIGWITFILPFSTVTSHVYLDEATLFSKQVLIDAGCNFISNLNVAFLYAV